MLVVSIMSARQARLMMADHRALEEEAERMNPVNPKRVLGAPKGYTGLMRGSGATPSMGLSQFRGGAGYESSSDSDGEQLVGSGHMVGCGTGAGRRKKGGAKSEAHQMGLHLSKHLQGLHGAGFWSDFKDGFMSVMKPVAGVVKSVAPMLGPEGMAVSGVLGALGAGKPKRGRPRGSGKSGRYEGKGKLVITHGGGTGAGMLGQDGHGQRKGAGFLSDLGIPVLSDVAGMVGLGTGAGKGGRSARAAIVKKVMSERGVSMIEASKIVKAEGLY